MRAAGRLAEAVDVLEEALKLHRATGDATSQAAVLGTLAYIQYRRGVDQDPRYAEEAVALLRTEPQSRHFVQALIGLAES